MGKKHYQKRGKKSSSKKKKSPEMKESPELKEIIDKRKKTCSIYISDDPVLADADADDLFDRLYYQIISDPEALEILEDLIKNKSYPTINFTLKNLMERMIFRGDIGKLSTFTLPGSDMKWISHSPK